MSNGFETCDQHTYLFATEGKDCPYCEIDRLKGELEEARDEAFKREARIMMYVNKNSDIKRQLDASQALLAEARAENERIGSVLGLQEYTKHIRQEAIKECLEFIDPITQIHVKRHFGLEG